MLRCQKEYFLRTHDRLLFYCSLQKINILRSILLSFSRHHRILVEPACGAALAAGYSKVDLGLDEADKDKPVVFIVCGGNMATAELFEGWRQQFGIDAKW